MDPDMVSSFIEKTIQEEVDEENQQKADEPRNIHTPEVEDAMDIESSEREERHGRLDDCSPRAGKRKHPNPQISDDEEVGNSPVRRK
jgi:hypothetical protein